MPATIGIDLIETVDDEIARVTADAAYEAVAFYAAAEMRDATVVVPPSKTREGVSASAAVARARSHDHGRGDVRPAPLEEGRPATSSRRGWRMRSFGTNRFSGIGFAPGPEAGEWPSPWSRVTS